MVIIYMTYVVILLCSTSYSVDIVIYVVGHDTSINLVQAHKMHKARPNQSKEAMLLAIIFDMTQAKLAERKAMTSIIFLAHRHQGFFSTSRSTGPCWG